MSVLFVLVRCSSVVVSVWLREVAGFVGEYEAVAPINDSASALYRSPGRRLVGFQA